MRKLFFMVLLLILAGNTSLIAQKYQSSNLAAYLAEHPTASSYDPATRCFVASTRLTETTASLSHAIMEIDRQLSDLAERQRKNAKMLLKSKNVETEDTNWQENQLLGQLERTLKEKKYAAIAQQQSLEQTSTRDSGILPDISAIVKDFRDSLADENAVYLNYLPSPADGNTHKNWLSSPLQVFLWSPHERYITEYIDHAYEISLIFPECRRPVVYQKTFERNR